MKLFNGEETLEFEKEKQTVFVKLEKHKCNYQN